MNLSDVCGELMREGFGVLEAGGGPVWPIGFGAKRPETMWGWATRI